MEPYYDNDGIRIYCGDCRAILPTLGTFDLLLTDPPYGLGDKMRGGFDGEWSRGGDREWSELPKWDLVTADLETINKCLICASESIIWGGNYYELSPVRCWLAWDKMQDHSSGHFEMAWTTLDKPTRMFRMCRAQAYGAGKSHPAQKPVRLMQWCIGLAGNEVGTVIDPFMGSGTTLVAAKKEGRRCVGIEINEAYCEIAVERLRQGVFAFE